MSPLRDVLNGKYGLKELQVWMAKMTHLAYNFVTTELIFEQGLSIFRSYPANFLRASHS